MALPCAEPSLAPRYQNSDLEQEDDTFGAALSASQRRLDLLRRSKSEELQELHKFLSGGVAGCVAKAAVAPLSRLTILMQVQSMRPHKFKDGVNANNTSLREGFRKIVVEEGFRALWRGTGATLAHRFPYACATFYINGALRQELDRAEWMVARAIPERLHGLAAGGGSAAIAVGLCHPLDVVKTRITAQTKRKYYTGTLNALFKIYRDEGPKGLYRGLGVSLLTTVPSIALNFGAYEHIFSFYSTLGLPGPLTALLAGASSGTVASTLLFPADLVRRQMQMIGLGGRPSVYANVPEAVRHIFATGQRRVGRTPKLLLGFREFYRGLAPELVKVTPYSAIMFFVHNWLQGLGVFLHPGPPPPPQEQP